MSLYDVAGLQRGLLGTVNSYMQGGGCASGMSGGRYRRRRRMSGGGWSQFVKKAKKTFDTGKAIGQEAYATYQGGAGRHRRRRRMSGRGINSALHDLKTAFTKVKSIGKAFKHGGRVVGRA